MGWGGAAISVRIVENKKDVRGQNSPAGSWGRARGQGFRGANSLESKMSDDPLVAMFKLFLGSAFP